MAKGRGKTKTGEDRYDFDRVVRWLVSVGTMVAVVLLLRYLADVLVPFVVALLIAYLLNPLVNLVEKWTKGRASAVLLTVGGGLLLLVVGVFIVVPLIGHQISDFQELIGELRTTGESPAGVEGDGQTLAQRYDAILASQKHPLVRGGLERLREYLSSDAFRIEDALTWVGTKIAPGVWGVVTGALQLLLGLSVLIVVLLYVVFLLNDFRHVQNTWKEILPPAYRESLVQFLGEFEQAMGRYFRGQFVIASLCGILFAVGFSLIGLRMGIILGLFVGLLNMVPYLQTLGLVPAVLLAVLHAVESRSSVMWSLLLVGVVFAVVQVVQDAILTPRIMGKATGLRPAVILLGVFVWGKLLGFLGVVMAIPLTCLGLAYYKRIVLNMKNAPVMVADD